MMFDGFDATIQSHTCETSCNGADLLTPLQRHDRRHSFLRVSAGGHLCGMHLSAGRCEKYATPQLIVSGSHSVAAM
jgi:hypothetical protein